MGEQLNLSTCRWAILFCFIGDVSLAFLANCMTHYVDGNIFMFLQMYAPTTLVPARDFWTLRYTTTMEDGSLVVCGLNCSFIAFILITEEPGH
jgi:hypothetical protein